MGEGIFDADDILVGSSDHDRILSNLKSMNKDLNDNDKHFYENGILSQDPSHLHLQPSQVDLLNSF